MTRLQVTGYRFLVTAFLFIIPITNYQSPATSATETNSKKVALWLPDGYKISVELALTPQEQEKGLMDRTFLPKDYGMLFVFPQEGVYQFWMKHTWVDLDILFIRKDKTVYKVFYRVPRSYPDTPEEKVGRVHGLAQYVLELPSGMARAHRIKQGQKIKFNLPGKN